MYSFIGVQVSIDSPATTTAADHFGLTMSHSSVDFRRLCHPVDLHSFTLLWLGVDVGPVEEVGKQNGVRYVEKDGDGHVEPGGAACFPREE